MQGVTSNVAANEIKKACKKQFPEKRNKHASKIYEELPQWLLKNITGTGKIKRDEFKRTTPSFEGTIENNTKDWVITEIDIELKLKNKGSNEVIVHKCNTFVRRPLFIGIGEPISGSIQPPKGIGPLTIGEFDCYNVYATDDVEFNWRITGARGYQY
jgi:hypothetical protein